MKTAHFQSFEQSSSPEKGPERLAALRAEMKKEQLDGFLVPRSDMFQGEYVARRDERLGWLTGFTGSAGFCVALMDKAGVFVDSRYTVQVRAQTVDAFIPVDWPKTTLEGWLKEHAQSGAKIGFDPWLHTLDAIEKSQNLLAPLGITLERSENLIDRIWTEQPDAPKNPAFPYDVKYAGKSAQDKLSEIASLLRDQNQAAMVITLPEDIAWLLNIRGSDVTHVPLVHCLGILFPDGRFDLFMDNEKTANIEKTLPKQVRFHPLSQFEEALSGLASPVRVDARALPYAVALCLKGAGVRIEMADNPISLPKACKNPVEIAQARISHGRDGSVMCEFLAWLDAQPLGDLSEIDVAIALEGFRRKNPELLDLSFDTISASGPNAALPHYRVTRQSNRLLQTGEVMLVDSGGQYLDGTTDITRTVALGAQSKEVCDAFTRVLKGMIAISCLKFPKGTKGQEMDSHARAALWAAGQDFGHGTGHGVGQFLSVHEGPQRISRADGPAFQVGMMVSNEPGFYKEGSFGIRTENLLLVQEASFDHTDQFLEFETLTYVPIDTRMIVKNLLTPSEIVWINHYHELCLNLHKDNVSPQTAAWLQEVTKPI